MFPLQLSGSSEKKIQEFYVEGHQALLYIKSQDISAKYAIIIFHI